MAIPGAALTRTYRISDTFKELTNNTAKSKDGTVTVKDHVMTIYSPGMDQWCYVYYPIYLPRGTVLEVKFEGRLDTASSEGRVIFDQYPTRDVLDGSGTVDWVQVETTQWKPYSFVYSGDHKKPYAYIRFGFSSTPSGRVHFRNIVINVYNVQAPNPDVRLAAIKFEPNKWTIDDGLGRFTNIGVHSVETDKDLNYITVRYARMQGLGMPITSAQVQSNFGNYNVHTVTFADMDYSRIYLIKSSTGEIIPPHRPSNGIIIAFSAMSF